jgi:hypothetical protein
LFIHTYRIFQSLCGKIEVWQTGALHVRSLPLSGGSTGGVVAFGYIAQLPGNRYSEPEK